MKASKPVGDDRFNAIGGGKLPDGHGGYIYASWTFVRLRLSASRVRFEPALWSNWITYKLPTWEASWDDLKAVTADGSRVRFIPKAGPVWTYSTLGGTDGIMAHVPLGLREVPGPS